MRRPDNKFAIDKLDVIHRKFLFDPLHHERKISVLRRTSSYWGCLMNKPTLVLLAAAMFLPCSSLAQHSSKAAESTPGQSASKASHKAITLTGQASADGKSLVADNDDIWTVTNPSVLAGFEGQYLIVRCKADADKKELHVLAAKATVKDAKYVSKSGDAAFRR